MNWTIELRSAQGPMLGLPREWICSGIPTWQPTPYAQVTELLRERGLLLFPDDPIEPRRRSRWLIGYVTRDPELMRLARNLAKALDTGAEHPLLTAARRIHAQSENPTRRSGQAAASRD